MAPVLAQVQPWPAWQPQLVYIPTNKSGRQWSQAMLLAVMLSYWIPATQRLELDRLWASQGLRPHGRTLQAMEVMIAAYLQSQRGQ
jgi:hypothetical protein